MTLCLYGHEEASGVDDHRSGRFDYIPVDTKARGTGAFCDPRLSTSFAILTHPPGLYGEDNESALLSPDPPRDQLQFIRETLKLNVSDLASVLGVSRPTVYAWLEGDEPSSENYTQIARLKRIADEVHGLAIPRFEKLLKRPIFQGLSFLDKLKASGEEIDYRALQHLAEKEHAARSARKGSGKTLSNDGFLEQSTPFYESD